MSGFYRLRYGGNHLCPAQKYLDVCALPCRADPMDPVDHRYFYAMRDGNCVCFIKRYEINKSGDDKRRYELEQTATRVSSPYVVPPYRNPLMEGCRLEYWDKEGWRELDGELLLFEYLPSDLRRFRNKWKAIGRDIPDHYRSQILLKLLQGVAHIHQARIVHGNIRPDNIMINSFEFYDEVPWDYWELDVKITNFDAAHDGYYSVTEVYTVTSPFQPDNELQPSVWLDIYSFCRVALWLYDETEGDLDEIHAQLPEAVEEIEQIMDACGAQISPFLKGRLLPLLSESIRKMKDHGMDMEEWTVSTEKLSALYRELSAILPGASGWRPMEILASAQRPQSWSAIVQLDREFWPVFGQGMEYCMLSLIDRLPSLNCKNLPHNSCFNGISTNSHHFERNFDGLGDQCCFHMLSAPPEIFVAAEYGRSVWSLKAGIFGAPYQKGTGYQNQRLAQKDSIFEGMDVELYNGPPVYDHPNKKSLFQNVRVHSARFYGENESPEPLPVFSGQPQNTAANINIVFIMPKPSKSREAPGVRLIGQVVDWVSQLGQCRPCYYGVIIRDSSLPGRSFCGGRLNPSARDMSEQYTAIRQDTADLSWEHPKHMRDRRSFDPGLPTVVIGFLDHPLDWKHDPVQHFWETALNLSPNVKYAVQYIQFFVTEQAGNVRELAPCLAAATTPDGACVLTPLTAEGQFPDPEGRWLTAVRRWYRR